MTNQPEYDWQVRLIRLVVLLLAALLLISAQAYAGKVKMYAPPGRAGTSQYGEDIPTGGGNAQPPSMTGGNKTAAQIAGLGSGKVGARKLATLGKAGAAAARFAEQTAPTRAAFGPTNQGSTRNHVTLAASGGSAITGLGHLIDGSDQGGIGIFLPLLLALSLIGTAVLGVRRSRRPD